MSTVNNLFQTITIVNLFFIINCSFIKPADPNFRIKPLGNEEHNGFISRDFFQIVVDVDKTKKEIPIQQKREDCKRRSVLIRNEKTIPILFNVYKTENDTRWKGINSLGNDGKSFSKLAPSGQTSNLPQAPGQQSNQQNSNQTNQTNNNQATGTTGNTSNTNNSNNANNSGIQGQNSGQNRQAQELSEEEFSERTLLALRGEFAWFIDSYMLYKEDYTPKEKCKFIYRVAKKGLYEKIEKSKIFIKPEYKKKKKDKDELQTEEL
ncbi:hypothetical protein [Leptospira sp. GIMC2001]|uniref:hypothetical protein n=1 Tax=Leptospira sp. GIMC2001 TaxID=1513297 RepID=UPI00234B07E6|nr:hypothetical protein [Leptospira sp. GIMC2001]WCL50829.1 hypothetical protein O4O04_08455 [Leptospira sp. GIMC2001]